MKKKGTPPKYSITGRLVNNEPNIQNIPIRTELGRKLLDVLQREAMEGFDSDSVYVYPSECPLEIFLSKAAKFYGNKV
ncbi:MAG: hypothetical protein DRQ39_11450 [Gammaproteobacteria bacterium]|nr:MAG: hypothetical protein DRQ39_11450 [Gammaproteobacteria bacterium]